MKRIDWKQVANKNGYNNEEFMLYDLFISTKLNLTQISKLIKVSTTAISVKIRKYKWYFKEDLKKKCQECGCFIDNDNELHCSKCFKALANRYNSQMIS
jgi:uncharacterized paraquat-inducible protein A